MKPLWNGILALAIVSLFCAAQVAAHGGEKHEEEHTAAEAEAPAAMDSIYAADGEEDAGAAQDSIYAVGEDGEEAGEPAGSLFTQQDLFGGETPSMDMQTMQHSEGSGSNHAGHEEPQVELAEHEMVSTDSKGYGVAAAITLLSGLVFGFLSFKRPNE